MHSHFHIARGLHNDFQSCIIGTMSKKYTKAEARALFDAKRDADLARVLGITPQALYHYGDDEALHDNQQWRIRALVAERRLKEGAA